MRGGHSPRWRCSDEGISPRTFQCSQALQGARRRKGRESVLCSFRDQDGRLREKKRQPIQGKSDAFGRAGPPKSSCLSLTFTLRALHPRQRSRLRIHPELEHLLPRGFFVHIAVRVPARREADAAVSLGPSKNRRPSLLFMTAVTNHLRKKRQK